MKLAVFDNYSQEVLYQITKKNTHVIKSIFLLSKKPVVGDDDDEFTIWASHILDIFSTQEIKRSAIIHWTVIIWGQGGG